MNKQEYLSTLKTSLAKYKIDELEEIMEEYESHFAFKLADGYAEEEIAARLENPKRIAEEYASIKAGEPTPSSAGRIATTTGLVLADIPVACFYILLFGFVIVIGAFAVAVAGAGVSLITGINIASLIPPMPYLGALLIGISFLALALLSAIATVYMYLYTVQLLKVYIRWHRNVLNNNIYPALPKYPTVNPIWKRRLRSMALLSIAIFASAFIIGFLYLMIHSGFKPFWHELGWFQS